MFLSSVGGVEGCAHGYTGNHIVATFTCFLVVHPTLRDVGSSNWCCGPWHSGSVALAGAALSTSAAAIPWNDRRRAHQPSRRCQGSSASVGDRNAPPAHGGIVPWPVLVQGNHFCFGLCNVQWCLYVCVCVLVPTSSLTIILVRPRIEHCPGPAPCLQNRRIAARSTTPTTCLVRVLRGQWSAHLVPALRGQWSAHFVPALRGRWSAHLVRALRVQCSPHQLCLGVVRPRLLLPRPVRGPECGIWARRRRRRLASKSPCLRRGPPSRPVTGAVLAGPRPAISDSTAGTTAEKTAGVAGWSRRETAGLTCYLACRGDLKVCLRFPCRRDLREEEAAACPQLMTLGLFKQRCLQSNKARTVLH